MPFTGKGRGVAHSRGPEKPYIRWGCILAPPDEYGEIICMAAVLRAVATITVASCQRAFTEFAPSPLLKKFLPSKNNYTVSPKKQDTILLSVTSPNVNRFFKTLSLLDSVGNL